MHTIDLAKPRVIPIQERGHTYTLTVRPISKHSWLKYFDGIVSTSENQSGKRIDSFDSSGARLALVTEALVHAEGYRVPDNKSITSVDGWQEKIPSAHRLAVGNVLITVERSASKEDEPIMLGFGEVVLDALWTSHDNQSMSPVKGLKHVFASPTADQQRRYSRDMSRSQVVGGSRAGKTRWLGAQATLAALYDELIVSTTGYTIDGHDIGQDKGQIVANMDVYHKVAAAESLFAPASAEIEEAAAE